MSSTSGYRVEMAKARQTSSKPTIPQKISRVHTDSGNESPATLDSPHPSPRTRFPSKGDAKKRGSLMFRSMSEHDAGMLTLQTPNRGDTRIIEVAVEDETVRSRAKDRKESAGKEASASKRSSASSACCSFRDQVRARCQSVRLFLSEGEWPEPEKHKRGSNDGPAERLISMSGIMQRRAKASEPSKPMLPLRPPHARTTSGIVHQRTVNLETPFASTMPRAYTESLLLSKSRANHSRDTSKSPIWKRIQRISGASGILGIQSPRKGRSKAHRSLEHENLHRVTSILDEMVETPSNTNDFPSDVNDARSAPLPEALLDAHLKKAKRNATFHLPAGIRTRYRAQSDASTNSFLQVPKIQAPLNTPEVHETYKIKRSPSADTEEFMKIDISVRGGTNYLPSEARRIQTPPLPGGGLGEKKTPFFFNYTAPYDNVTPKNDPSQIGQPISTKKTDLATENRTGDNTDWIDKELAEVDAVGDDVSTKGMISKIHDRECLTGEVDLSVPEHFPTSPLCPRHSKHRSGGTESCWMHGRSRRQA